MRGEYAKFWIYDNGSIKSSVVKRYARFKQTTEYDLLNIIVLATDNLTVPIVNQYNHTP